MKEIKEHLTLPLHPRKQQQIFMELLQVQAHKTPHLTNDTPLQRRLESFQSMYLKSLQELKQGSNVVYYSSFSIATSGAKMSTRQIKADLFLQLSADGKRVVGLPFQDDATSATPFIEFQVQDIVRIKLSDLSANRIYFHVELESQTITFTMSCKTITKHWVIGLICGATAMNPRKVRDLIWQAARLRICELTSKMEFIEAVKIVQEALEQLTQGDGYPPSILNHLLIQYTE